MSRAGATDRTRSRTVALMLAVGLAVPLAGPTLAADPTPTYRPDRPAWDRVASSSTSDLAGAADQRLIVRFAPGSTRAARRTATDHPDVARVVDLPASGIAVVRATGGDPTATIAERGRGPNVRDVSVDARNYRDVDPQAEPAWSELWGLHNTGQRLYEGEPGTEGRSNVDIDGLQALGIEQGDAAVVVAVIDDGVDFSHPDLDGQAWTNPGESGDGKESNGVDDDGNGYVDDVHGWDFCDDDNTVHDFNDDFHGTHVAGTIAAKLNGEGIVGVAPGVRIMALKFIANHFGCGFDSQAIEAIAYAKSFGVRIANGSWGSRRNPNAFPALKNAIARSGLLFVASAGNEGIDNDGSLPAVPASYDLPNILSVAAVDNDGFIPNFSNYGKKSVDIAAPGAAILSALPADESHPVGWGWLDGTSMAAPHAAGVAALVLSASPGLGADPAALRARLLASGKVVSRTTGRTATGRIVDAFRALDFVAPLAAAPTGFGFVKNSILGKSSVRARVSWPAAVDEMTGIAGYRAGVQQSGGSWKTQVSSTTSRSTDRTLALSTTYAFRVRAFDLGGNWGPYAIGPNVRASRYQESTSLATYGGTWGTSKDSSWSGSRTRYARRAGASVTFRFTGRAFAVVAPKGPSRGAFKLYVDGVLVGTVDLHRSKTLARVLVATRTWSSTAAHTVKLVVIGTSGHPRIDVDAFLVMR
jgi:subtilisin family serine protease